MGEATSGYCYCRVLEGKGPYGRTSTTARTANTVFWLRVSNVVSSRESQGTFAKRSVHAGSPGCGRKDMCLTSPVTALAPAVLFAASATEGPAVNRSNIRPRGPACLWSTTLKYSHSEGWIAAVACHGHFNSLGWVIAPFSLSVCHILISS